MLLPWWICPSRGICSLSSSEWSPNSRSWSVKWSAFHQSLECAPSTAGTAQPPGNSVRSTGRMLMYNGVQDKSEQSLTSLSSCTDGMHHHSQPACQSAQLLFRPYHLAQSLPTGIPILLTSARRAGTPVSNFAVSLLRVSNPRTICPVWLKSRNSDSLNPISHPSSSVMDVRTAERWTAKDAPGRGRGYTDTSIIQASIRGQEWYVWCRRSGVVHEATHTPSCHESTASSFDLLFQVKSE